LVVAPQHQFHQEAHHSGVVDMVAVVMGRAVLVPQDFASSWSGNHHEKLRNH
jgi:hypothetical protein